MNSCLFDRGMVIYSTCNEGEGKSAVGQGFIMTLKIKTRKHVTISKNMYIDQLDEIVDKYSNTYHK